MMDKKIQSIFEKARKESRENLLEIEGMALLQAAGIACPKFSVFAGSDDASKKLSSLFPGEKAVVKAISAEILHKTELQAVRIVPNQKDKILEAITEMEESLKGSFSLNGFSLSEFIPYSNSLGNEFLLSFRHTDDFGLVISLGIGGTGAESISRLMIPGKELAMFTIEDAESELQLQKILFRTSFIELSTAKQRGQEPHLEWKVLLEAIKAFVKLAKMLANDVSEFEINPLVIHKKQLFALDALVKLKPTSSEVINKPPTRPLQKIQNLLKPKTIGIIGVSEKNNPGRVILKNILSEDFPSSKIFLVKSDTNEIEGCRCFSTIEALPERVDLFIIAVSAAQVPDLINELIKREKAESIIIIPGGLEEKAGTNELVQKMHHSIQESRATKWQGPVINGGNCLGITSKAGKYNTMFIPKYKLPEHPYAKNTASNWALLSQSGAFAIARMNKLSFLPPSYCITYGNQMDLSIGDYLNYFKEDLSIHVFATYVEGFKNGDGEKFIQAAKEIAASGRKVILYRAGRSEEGSKATSSHTASLASPYDITRELAKNANIIIAENIEEFEDYIQVFTLLHGKKIKNKSNIHLAALSNAGFECVSFADHFNDAQSPSESLKLANFSKSTESALLEILKKSAIHNLVDIHNPLDITPMANDVAFVAVVKTLLMAEEVDAALIGCIPLTPALQTLEKDSLHEENVESTEAIANKLISLQKESKKPFVFVIDSGATYESFRGIIQAGGIPCYPSSDRAARSLRQFLLQ